MDDGKRQRERHLQGPRVADHTQMEASTDPPHRKAPRYRPVLVRLALGLLIILIVVQLQLLNHDTDPILASVPVGMLSSPGGIDEQAGRAFILSNSTIDQAVTVQGNVYGWSSSSTGSVIHVIDTRSGKQTASIDLSQNYPTYATVDAATHRLFVIDIQFGQVQLFDTRTARLVATAPYTDDGSIQSAVSDNRTGSLLLSASAQDGNDTQIRIIALDGHTGRLRWIYQLPPAQQSVIRRRGQPPMAVGPSPPSLALDSRTGRLYAFSYDGLLRVLDAGTGRVLLTRQLSRITITILDMRTGAVLRTLTPQGRVGYPMAVDRRSGHLIAVRSTMLSAPPDQWRWMPDWLRARVPNIPPPPPTLGPSERIMHDEVVTLDLNQ